MVPKLDFKSSPNYRSHGKGFLLTLRRCGFARGKNASFDGYFMPVGKPYQRKFHATTQRQTFFPLIKCGCNFQSTGNDMLQINKSGAVVDDHVKNAISPFIEHADMKVVHGIIVHQTGGSTAQSSLDSYKNKGANGAHFLIDKDGTIYQTASVHKQTWHVGKLKCRCMLELKCSPAEKKLNQTYNPTKENEREQKKPYPDRFPSNQDSIGIELVGEAVATDPKKPSDQTYVTVTEAQNKSLKWLVGELEITLNIPTTEVFRHPVVSRKNPSEASTARW